MNYVYKLFFLSVFLMSALVGKALVSSTAPTFTKKTMVSEFSKHSIEAQLGRKLKFKEKAALWIFRKKLKRQAKKWSKTNLVQDTTKCGTIFLKTGDELSANILAVMDNSVKFTLCGQDDTLSLSKDDIIKVSLSDGVVLYANKNKKIRKPRNATLGILSVASSLAALAFAFVFPILGFLFALLALVFGIAGFTGAKGDNRSIARLGFLSGIFTMIYAIHRLVRKSNRL